MGDSAVELSLELIFMGTGTSSSLPNINCLTAFSVDKPCATCLSTLHPNGKKNIRRNTSCAFKMSGRDGRPVTIVIDSGKDFQAAALEWFPKYGMRKIDALLLTHSHADAINGLDDLRGWTLNSVIQPYIDVYLSQATFSDIRRSFPYLVTKEFASGGGDVASFRWHIIEDTLTFEILDTGIWVTPFSVHHGRVFSVPECSLPSSSIQPLDPMQATNSTTMNREQDAIQPYLCYGFKINNQVVYMSDVSSIPDDKWFMLERVDEVDWLPVLVLDCLRLRPHVSHMGIENAVQTARRIGASRTYLVGFSHDVSHDEYVALGEAVGGKIGAQMTDTVKSGLQMIPSGRKVWVRPAHDGLRVFVGVDRKVWDESYHTTHVDDSD